MNPKIINLETWKRKEHFLFFNQMSDPFFAITTEIDCTKTYINCKLNKSSFFLSYLFKTMQVIDKIEAFKTRIKDNRPLVYETIDCTCTVLRNDDTFGFTFFEKFENYNDFELAGKKSILETKKSTGLNLNADTGKLNVIHFSVIPWINFSMMKHPFDLKPQGGIPKISFGKVFKKGSRYKMNMSIEVHHGIADAKHISNFLEMLDL